MKIKDNVIHGMDYLEGYGNYDKDKRFRYLKSINNPDPAKDSAIRALSLISGKQYYEIYKALFNISIKDEYLGTVFNHPKVIEEYLLKEMNMCKINCENNYFTIMNFISIKQINNTTCILVVRGNYYVPIINRTIIDKESLKTNIEQLLMVKNILKIYYFPSAGGINIENYLPYLPKNRSVLGLFDIPIKQNGNPGGISYMGCSLRAISYATGISWEETYQNLFKLSLEKIGNSEDDKNYKNHPPILYNSSLVYAEYLENLGFTRFKFNKRTIPINFFIYNREALFIIVTKTHMMVYDHGVLVDDFLGISPLIINCSLVDSIMEIYFKEELIDTLYI